MQVSAVLASHPVFRAIPSLAERVPIAGGVLPPPFDVVHVGCTELVSLLQVTTTSAVSPAPLQEAIGLKNRIDLAVAVFGLDANLQQLAADGDLGFGRLYQRIDTFGGGLTDAIDDIVISIDDLDERVDERLARLSERMDNLAVELESQRIRSTNPARALARLPVLVPRHLGRPLPQGVPGEFANPGGISNAGTAVLRGMVAYYLEADADTLPVMSKEDMVPVIRRLLGLDSVMHA